MTDKTGAEVIDLIEGFNFNLGSAIDCIARADGKQHQAQSVILKERNGTWNVKSNGSNTTAKAPCRRLKRQLREPPHRFVNSASVNRTAPYGKTGWATSIGSVTGHGST